MSDSLFSKGEVVTWRDIHGRDRNALVEMVTPELVEIRVTSSLGDTLVLVDQKELSPQ